MLLDLVLKNNIKTLSVVGMAKNVGKTIAFNHLAKEAAKHGMRLGLTSVGRDGEKKDAVFFFPKPRIFALPGMIIATVLGRLKNGDAELEILRYSGFHTSLGEVVIGRVSKAGFFELAGPTLIKQHKEIIRYMSALGADLVLIDGALDRTSSAAPSLTEGTILATGAVLAAGMGDVLDKTRDRIERFALQQTDKSILRLCRSLIDKTKAVLISENLETRVVETQGSLIAGDQIAAELTPDFKTVLLPGAVGNNVLEHLIGCLEKTGHLELVIRNGTCLFSDRSVWQKFIAKGGTIKVIEPIHLLAVTLNPTSPNGTAFDRQVFLETARKVLAPYPVVDVVWEEDVC